ncbi:MAG: hypothetical protein IJ397_05890 [Lachnospiraceae bacterium]|nr:hypothetical protein [Lachnospiraceae bacterium]
MRKIKISALILICMFGLVACTASEQEITEENSVVEEESVGDSEDNISEDIADDSGENNGVVESSEILLQDEDVRSITIDLSDVKETYAEGDAVTPLNLKIISEEENGITWADDWYNEMNLSLPMVDGAWKRFYDATYEYLWIDECLKIYERETGKHLYTLEYPTDRWYVNGNNAYIKDGIFYGASIANGYADSDTCFMFAYDLNNEKILWRSASQSYNTMNFIVIDDVIICGYGFTEEKDYLYQINMNTGEVIDKLELKKMPDLLVEQDGKIYVHTYSYDYVIEIDS